MAIVNATNLTAAQIMQQVISALRNHRQALEVINDLFAWSSGISAADLTAAPINMPASDANAILGAIADAHAEVLIHTTGQPPGSYPQAASAYIYAASQNQVIGPTT